MKHVVIFARRPEAGRVKTRLAKDIGTGAALRFYRTSLFGLVHRLEADQRWKLWLGVTPDSSVADGRGLPRRPERLPQGRGDLGARMERCMGSFGRMPVIILGSDIPEINRRHVARAFVSLRTNDLVFGPSPDGGYWLVGAAQGERSRGLFHGVRWSTRFALSDTIANAGSGIRIAMIDTLADIDSGPDHARWKADRGKTNRFQDGSPDS